MIVLAIPYSNFREKLAITKQYSRKGRVEVFDGFIYIEMINHGMNN